MLVIAFHEFSHAITSCCTGGRVESISLDPHEGGVTHMRGGLQAITLPAGYLGSSLIGMLLTFCGFDIVASKIASIVLGVCFLLTLWWGKKDWLTIGTVLLAVGLLVACWFIAHSEALRFFVLFIGVMSSLYSVWDICDDLILRKVNSSDASQFAKRYGGSSQCWGVIWSVISVLFMAAGIVAGIAVRISIGKRVILHVVSTRRSVREPRHLAPHICLCSRHLLISICIRLFRRLRYNSRRTRKVLRPHSEAICVGSVHIIHGSILGLATHPNRVHLHEKSTVRPDIRWPP